MKSVEEMSNTNTLVFKNEDNVKIIITKKIIGDNVSYIVKIWNGTEYTFNKNQSGIDMTMQLDEMILEESSATMTIMLLENIVVKEEYHIVDGYKFGKFNEFHIPFIEEDIKTTSMNVFFDNIKEITGDIQMIQEMIDKGILCASTFDLAKFNIFVRPELLLIENKVSTSGEDKKNYPPLRVVNKIKLLKK